MKTYLFYWHGIDQNQTYVKGSCVARNLNDLKQQLLKRQVLLCKSQRKLWNNKLTTKQTTFVLNQMLTFLHAGIPIIKTLEMIRDNQESQSFSQHIDDLKNKIEAGESLSSSLMYQVSPKEKIMIEMMRVGERSGHLIRVLEHLIKQREKEQRIRGKLKRALIYPSFLIVASIAIVSILMVWAIPEFKQTYESMGAALPKHTANTIYLSLLIKTYGAQVAVALTLFVLSIAYLRRKIPYLEWVLAKLQLRTPLLGTLIRTYLYRHFAANIYLAYQAGIPLEEALSWLVSSAVHPVYCHQLDNVRQSIRRGKNLHTAIQDCGFFSNFIFQVIQAGEHSGTLNQSLEKIEQHYNDNLENAVKVVMQLIEPILITGIAICVGWLIVSIYLPIFNLGIIL